MSIAKRLRIGSALITVAMLLAIVIAAYGINLVRIGGPIGEQIQAQSDYVADILPPPEYVLEPFLEATLLASHPEEVDMRATRLAALRKAYDERHAYWNSSTLDPALVTALTRDADAPAQRFWAEVDQMIAAARAHDAAQLARSYASVSEAYAAHRTRIDTAVTLAGKQQAELKAHSETTLTITAIALLALAVTILALAIGSRLYLTHRVMAPLGQLVEATDALADGAERSVPHLDRVDELGHMARAVDTFRRAADERAAQEAQASAEQKEVADALGQVLRTMAAGDLRGGAALRFPESYAAVNRDLNDAVDTLRSMVQAVVETTTEIGGASDSIARATGDLAQRTESSAAVIEQTSAAVGRMDARLRSTVQAAHKSSDGSQATLAAAGEVRVRADGAMEAMNRVSSSAAGIDDVIEGLDKIAFQTRVLAMNAAVEAGRAGGGRARLCRRGRSGLDAGDARRGGSQARAHPTERNAAGSGGRGRRGRAGAWRARNDRGELHRCGRADPGDRQRQCRAGRSNRRNHQCRDATRPDRATECRDGDRNLRHGGDAGAGYRHAGGARGGVSV